jgi:2-dehydro-3-deoxyphosphogluconate aldolase / (4S)-4-hydroxy-2-oxoglutarate aldolase
MSDVLERIRALKIVPVIVIDDPVDAAPLGAALSEGGLPCAEVTFRTRGAADAIRRMKDAHPEMLVGAGTVLSPAQVSEARSAGATFIVSPGFNPAVVDASQEQGLPVFPGVCTPTEVDAAMAKGLRVLKFFPAEAIGGVNLLKAIMAPYGEVRFIPTGGVTRENIGKYLALKAVVACGGSWMAPQQMVAAKQFDRVREETAAAVAAVRQPEGAK